MPVPQPFVNHRARYRQTHADALKIIDLMLERNPNDNQGVRYLLGSVALQSGDRERARCVRRGFAATPYIAEMLTGHPNPAMLPIWHDSNLAEPETADAYFHTYGTYWSKAPGSRAFTRWLFNHSKVMVERTAILECKEAMLSATDGPARVKIAKREAQLTAAIDDTISKAIVVKRKDAQGRADWPWSVE